jgi:aconitate hydratase 2/2-methylisocitrate dehydratase
MCTWVRPNWPRCARLGRIPTKEEYMSHIGVIDKNAAEIYRYMNFDQIEEFREVADTVKV